MGVSRTWGALRTAWNTSLRQSVRRALPGRRLMGKSASTSDWIAAYRSAGLSRVDSAAAVIVDFFYIFYLSQFPGLPSLPLALSAASVLTIGVRLDNVDMQDDSKFGPGSVYDRAAALPPLPAGSGWLEFCADVAVCGAIIKDRETVWTGFPCQLPEVCLSPAALMDLRWIDGMVGPFYGAALRLLGMDGPAGRIISGVGDCGCARLAMDQLVRYNELADIIHDQYLDLPLNDVLAATGLSGRFDPSAYQFSCNVVVERISRCPRHDEDTQDLLAGIASGAVVPYTIIPRYNLLVELASHGPPPEPQWYCVPLEDAVEYDCSTFLAEDWSVSNFPTLRTGSGGAARAAALRTSNVASQSATICSYEAVLDSLGGGCSLETFLGFLASHESFDDSVARSTLGGFWDLLTARAPRHSDVAAFFLQYKSALMSRPACLTGGYNRLLTGLMATIIEATTLNPYARLSRLAASPQPPARLSKERPAMEL
ncbi:hypothetical protein B0J15DRAFT_552774 [Fusarium solani]|uniref:Uncharacterized protein n=1 Tax=Fusarium solani TaxID=169388 RepID=A0A9P9GSE3_FUSSL|nr:uncharacterized protein B0J15DRAFT_552774 [Fusarium solani]KAH7243917.1 hypothetical protein B0J15DRAFT_552774 [Fusarium solani]